jgi:two-component system sensor histidine kinase KdpD
MFYRTRSSDAKGAGPGLGLAICRGIVEAHGGTIHIDAGLHGTGTCVIIRLAPADFAPQVPADEVSSR